MKLVQLHNGMGEVCVYVHVKDRLLVEDKLVVVGLISPRMSLQQRYNFGEELSEWKFLLIKGT